MFGALLEYSLILLHLKIYSVMQVCLILLEKVAARCAYYPKFFQGIPELLTLNYRIAVKNAELQVTSSSRVHKRLQK